MHRDARALTCAACLWLVLAAALVAPAIAGAALYSRLTDTRQGRSAYPRRSVLLAFAEAFVATGAILVVQTAIVAGLGSRWMRRLRSREAGPERAQR